MPTRPPSWRTTWLARVGLTLPNGFGGRRGDRAARGADERERDRVRRDPEADGVRPAVTMPGMTSRRRRTSVRAGQKRAASVATRGSAASSSSAYRATSAASARWTMIGSNRGRALSSKTRATASGSRASAPSPYTVSVGNATGSPARIAAAASATAAGSSPGRTRVSRPAPSIPVAPRVPRPAPSTPVTPRRRPVRREPWRERGRRRRVGDPHGIALCHRALV